MCFYPSLVKSWFLPAGRNLLVLPFASGAMQKRRDPTGCVITSRIKVNCVVLDRPAGNPLVLCWNLLGWLGAESSSLGTPGLTQWAPSRGFSCTGMDPALEQPGNPLSCCWFKKRPHSKIYFIFFKCKSAVFAINPFLMFFRLVHSPWKATSMCRWHLLGTIFDFPDGLQDIADLWRTWLCSGG